MMALFSIRWVFESIIIWPRLRLINIFVEWNQWFIEFLVPKATTQISILLVSHELNGELKTFQPMKLDDLNLCGMNQQNINFGENLASACQIDLRTLIEMGERKPSFLNLYLNYTENGMNLVKAMPILIRNSFTYNMVKDWLFTFASFPWCFKWNSSFTESIRSREVAISQAILHDWHIHRTE